MSLRSQKRRLAELERRSEYGHVTVVTTSGNTFRIPQRRVLKMLSEAMELARPFDWAVPDEVLANRPDLLAVKNMAHSDEDGALLDLVKICLLGPVWTPSFELEQVGSGAS